MLVWAAQSCCVAVHGTCGDVSISMAIDVATMLLLPPFVAAANSASGTSRIPLSPPLAGRKNCSTNGNGLPVVPFMLTTTLGGLAYLIWKEQPAATLLLFKPVITT